MATSLRGFASILQLAPAGNICSVYISGATTMQRLPFPSSLDKIARFTTSRAILDVDTVYTQSHTDSTPSSVSIPSSVKTFLPLLAAQPPHYATIHIHARPFLLTEGDTVRLPFRIPRVYPGDILRLTCASTVGSRDYTLRGSPYIDERLFECRAVVSSVDAEPLRLKEKTVRRNRKVKTVKSKHRYTELVIKQLRVKSEL